MVSNSHERSRPDPLHQIRELEPIQCGLEVRKHFAFEDGYLNLNHGSYGTYPTPVRDVFRHYQERSEAEPDIFVRYEYRPKLLDASRAVIAKYLHAPVETCVYVPNASMGVDTILHNLVYRPGDVIVCFWTVYESFENTILHLAETTPVQIHKIPRPPHGPNNPLSDARLCAAFVDALTALRAQGKNPRLALFDTISSLPGIRMPFEALTRLSAAHAVLSLLDGAHGAGHLPLDLSALDPDFFVTNCHKWLHVPRSCGVLVVPKRNQHLVRATVPTGFSYPRVPSGDNGFVANFASVGTRDDCAYLCVEAALAWRSRLVCGNKRGEEAVEVYVRGLAGEGGRMVARVLGTETMEDAVYGFIPGGDVVNAAECAFANVRLPLLAVREMALMASQGEVRGLTAEEVERTGAAVGAWVQERMILEYRTAVYVYFYAHEWWVRLSAQVYLTHEDFAVAAIQLKEICRRACDGEWTVSKTHAMVDGTQT